MGLMKNLAIEEYENRRRGHKKYAPSERTRERYLQEWTDNMVTYWQERIAKLRAVMRNRLGTATFDGETAAGRPPRDDLIMIRVVDTADGGARSGRLRETLRASVAAIDVDVVRRLAVVRPRAAPVGRVHHHIAVRRPRAVSARRK